MVPDPIGRSRSSWLPAILLFVYGGVVHFVLFRLWVHWTYRNSPNRNFVDDPRTLAAVCLLGGVWCSICLTLTLRRLAQGQPQSRSIIARWFGAAGIVGTALAVECFLIFAASYAGSGAQHGESVSVPGLGPILMFIELQTYGIEPIVHSVSYAFAYGAVAGLLLMAVSNSVGASGPVREDYKSLSRLALVLAVMGFLAMAFLPVSLTYACLSVAVGILSLRRGEPPRTRRLLSLCSIGISLATIALDAAVRMMK